MFHARDAFVVEFCLRRGHGLSEGKDSRRGDTYCSVLGTSLSTAVFFCLLLSSFSFLCFVRGPRGGGGGVIHVRNHVRVVWFFVRSFLREN